MSLPHRGPAAFASRELVAELLGIQSEKRSCVVVVRAEGTSVSLHFEEGKLVHAEDGTTAKSLGRLLVDEGKISEEDLAGLLDALTLADARGKNVRLGDLAVARGLLTRKELSLALFAQVRRKVVAAIGWDDPVLEILPLPPREPGRERARFPTPLEPVILSAFRKLASKTIASRLAPYGHGKVALDGDRDAIFALFRPKNEERDTLARVLDDPDGRLVDDLATGALPDEGLAFVATLIVTGHLARAGGPISQRKKPPPTPSTVVRSAARLRLLRTAKLQMLAPIVRVNGSADIGTHAVQASDPAPGSPAAKLRGERAFLDGRAHMAQGREALAKAELWRAHRLVPTATEYELYLAWLTLRGDDTRAAELEALALRAKRQDPELGFASYVLSHLALLRGDVESAEAEQQRAQRLGARTSTHEGLRPIAHAGSSASYPAVRPIVSRRTGRGLPFRAKKASASTRPTRLDERMAKPVAPSVPPEERVTPLVEIPRTSVTELVDEGGWDDVADGAPAQAAQPATTTPPQDTATAPPPQDAATATSRSGSDDPATATDAEKEPSDPAEPTSTPPSSKKAPAASATMKAAAPASERAPASASRIPVPRPTPSTKMRALQEAEALAAIAKSEAVTAPPPPSSEASETPPKAEEASPVTTRGLGMPAVPDAEPIVREPTKDASTTTNAKEEPKEAPPSDPPASAAKPKAREADDAPRSSRKAPASDDGPPSSEAVPASEAAPARPEVSRAPLYFALVGLLAVLGVGGYMYAREPEAKPTPPASASVPVATAPPSASVATPTEGTDAASPDGGASSAGDAGTGDASTTDANVASDAAPQDAEAPSDASTAATPSVPDAAPRENGMGITGWKTGNIVPEGAPRGHRIFVDTHAVGETPATVSAPCGVHQVQIGSKGTPRKIDISCGGSVTVKP